MQIIAVKKVIKKFIFVYNGFIAYLVVNSSNHNKHANAITSKGYLLPLTAAVSDYYCKGEYYYIKRNNKAKKALK